jgi:hypothetical protein
MAEPFIPKKIHYCWYGGQPLPSLAKRCLKSWKIHLADYEVKRWDENNTDLLSNQYVREAYQAGKYAFVSDYVRLKVLYEEGGIYMDTDVELIKNLDTFLHHHAFCGFQNPTLISLGVIGSVRNHNFIRSILDIYDCLRFVDEENHLDLTPNTVRITNYAVKKGLELNDKLQNFNDLTVYPSEYFCPKNYDEYYFNITKNTKALHHYAGSWYSPKTKWLMWFRIHIIKRFLPWIDTPLRKLYHRMANR